MTHYRNKKCKIFAKIYLFLITLNTVVALTKFKLLKRNLFQYFTRKWRKAKVLLNWDFVKWLITLTPFHMPIQFTVKKILKYQMNHWKFYLINNEMIKCFYPFPLIRKVTKIFNIGWNESRKMNLFNEFVKAL